jgi:hypothetical protein
LRASAETDDSLAKRISEQRRELDRKLAGNLDGKLLQMLAALLDSKHRPLHRDKLVTLLRAKLGNKLATNLSA